MFSAILLLIVHRFAPIRVVIDCGHGGRDPGMHFSYRGRTFYEAAITYQVGIRLREKCRQYGFEPIMTTQSKRAEKGQTCLILPSDAHYTIKPKARVHANVHGCSVRTDGWSGKRTIYISLHVDSLPGATAMTGGTLYHEPYDKPCSFAKTLEASLRRHNLERKCCGTTQAPIIRSENLQIYNCPAACSLGQKVLYEMGFPNSSPSDAERLTTEAGQQKIVNTIVDALLTWKDANSPS